MDTWSPELGKGGYPVKKIIAVLLSLYLLSSVGVSALAAKAEQTPKELYQAYEAIVEEANETYGLDLALCPLEDLDQDHMSPVQGFQADVDELVKTILFLDEEQGGREPEPNFFQGLFRRLFGPSKENCGVGTKTVSVNTAVYAEGLGIDWDLSPIFAVNTPTGEPSYYLESVRGVDMVPTTLPTGYKAVADGSPWYEVSENQRDCTVYQQFTLTKNAVSGTATPWVAFHVDGDTGVITVGDFAS